MRSTIAKIFNYGAMVFMAGLLVLFTMTLSKPSLGEGGTPKIQILPREVTSQPLTLALPSNYSRTLMPFPLSAF